MGKRFSDVPAVSSFVDTDLFHILIDPTGASRDKKIIAADLRKGILSGGKFVNLSRRATLNGNGLYSETVDAVPTIWLRNISSTVERYPEVCITNFAGNTGGFPHLTFYNIMGSLDAPQPAINGGKIGAIIGLSHDGVDYAEGARIDFNASGAWSPDSHGAEITFSTLAPGETGIPKLRMKIKADGNLDFSPPRVVTGSRSDGTALTNLLTTLSSMGIIVDNTTP